MNRWLLLVLVWSLSVAQSAELPERQSLIRKAYLVRPNATDFVWKQYPWHLSAETALKAAQEEKRPLFVWLFNGGERAGHPLEHGSGYAADLRDGPISDVPVMKSVSSLFVPVVLHSDRLSTTDAGKFFQSLTKQAPQGLWIVTPTGKVLGHHVFVPDPRKSAEVNGKQWVEETRAMITTAVKESGELKPRTVRPQNPFPERGFGFTTDGGVQLAVSVIATRHGRQEGHSVHDHVSLSKADWNEFLPPEKLTEWTIPETTAKKFSVALSSSTDSTLAPLPADLTEAKLTAKLIRAEDGQAVIQFVGEWKARCVVEERTSKFPETFQSTGEGVAVIDPTKRELINVLFVLKGKSTQGNVTIQTASIVEWERGQQKQ